MRLLPWTSDTGQPCYLSTDNPDSRMSRLADRVEAELLESASDVLDHAKDLFRGRPPHRRELTFAGTQLAAALEDTLRIAKSRGVRLAPEE
ncbi:hypothetical protein IAG44_29390 [Streptomyces roseirectus]|uniref:Uncharacterized protein n=1 Tax=Streptomyces roseirectus TaxID=2768066 RepID=A0A7H0IK29_9ACTN|nr:hypothetical protein [Streptomyces roseirectus]QNP73145.1 hypothetical protein IAG44_29390 [Streptomyces roseirectus]